MIPCMSRPALYENLNGGPAPQYDFCGQRGPVKREMSQSDNIVHVPPRFV